MRKFNGTRSFMAYTPQYVAWLEDETKRLKKENARLKVACEAAHESLTDGCDEPVDGDPEFYK